MKNQLAKILLLCVLILGCEKKGDSNLNKEIDSNNKKSIESAIDGEDGYFLGRTNPLCKDPKIFDIYSPPSEVPNPLIIAFHGGGFISGLRSSMYPFTFNNSAAHGGFPWITESGLKNRKIAYATVKYSLSKENNYNNIADALNDCKSYIDFFSLPANASEYNIDPTRIILMGQSAGASAALWIGLQGLYPSIKGLICFDPQASLDIDRWASTIFNNDPNLVTFCQNEISSNPIILDIKELAYRETLGFTPINYDNLHLLDLISPDDPEVYLVSYNVSSYNTGDVLHHDRHIHKLITKSINVGHNKMKFMYDNSDAYWGYQYPMPETILNFCDRLF